MVTTTDIIDFLSGEGRDKKYCFVMGSGCSVENGIPTGWGLASKWYSELGNVYSGAEIDEWKRKENVNDDNFGSDYAKIFTFRFAKTPQEGYEAINREIERGRIGIGHIILAQLMLKTGSNVVITTNFDTLVEETLYTFTNSRPIICGHESVAKFARPSTEHPLIIKIHRDRFMDPFNLDEEIAVLQPEWTSVLNHVFTNFIPIVVGYGGNDGSLMGYLRNAQPCERLFWCVTSDHPLRDDIMEVINHHHGEVIKIEGFNRFMLRLAAIYQIGAVDQMVTEKAGRLSTDYVDSLLNLSVDISQAGVAEELASFAKLIEQYTENDWWYWELKARMAPDDQTAYAIYEQGLKKLPASADLNYYYAWLLMDKFPQRALPYLRKAIKIDPRYADAWYHLGLIYKRKKQFKKAIPYFQKAIEIASGMVSARNQLAAAYHDIGDYERAIAIYNSILVDFPNRAQSWNNLGFTYRIQGNIEKAMKCFRKAMRLDDSIAKPLFNIALIYYRQGDNHKAIQYFQKAIQKDPKSADTYYNMGLAFENLNNKEKARAAFKQAFLLNPNDKGYKDRYDQNG